MAGMCLAQLGTSCIVSFYDEDAGSAPIRFAAGARQYAGSMPAHSRTKSGGATFFNRLSILFERAGLITI